MIVSARNAPPYPTAFYELAVCSLQVSNDGDYQRVECWVYPVPGRLRKVEPPALLTNLDDGAEYNAAWVEWLLLDENKSWPQMRREIGVWARAKRAHWLPPVGVLQGYSGNVNKHTRCTGRFQQSQLGVAARGIARISIE